MDSIVAMVEKLEIVCFHNGAPTVAFFLRPEQPTTIGRAIENVVTLNDERCSRFHATIEQRDGKWRLFDLNSRNGTIVDGATVSGSVEIFVGSKIQIGRELLLIAPQRDFSEAVDPNDAQNTSRASNFDFFRRENELTAYLDCERTENRRLRNLLGQNSQMIGASPLMRAVDKLIDRAARSKATALIRGESGVGKELVARAMHERSARRLGPMVCLNCAAFSENLLTSELFGHEKGAFTGALETKIGKFEAADGGTIFLDEIAEMNPGLQATFLRVLEGATFERVGGNKPISVDVRVVAATNRNLEEEVRAGRFRSDLYFRLRVLEINVPPLRERQGDVDILADYFLDKFSQETGRRYLGFSPEARATLNAYRWPGNVRELKNIVERAVLMGNPPTINNVDLMTSALGSVARPAKPEASDEAPGNDSAPSEAPRAKKTSAEEFEPMTLKDMESRLILQTLNHFAWNKSKSAKALGIERTTLDRKIALYNLSR
ncbi:MAG: sigma 54-interacting transcriptional regulator [Planctomycetia bacterium]|nr:sigma 54-interacting transcriptional regulator [Planctomycetia bacterium]